MDYLIVGLAFGFMLGSALCPALVIWWEERDLRKWHVETKHTDTCDWPDTYPHDCSCKED